MGRSNRFTLDPRATRWGRRGRAGGGSAAHRRRCPRGTTPVSLSSAARRGSCARRAERGERRANGAAAGGGAARTGRRAELWRTGVCCSISIIISADRPRISFFLSTVLNTFFINEKNSESILKGTLNLGQRQTPIMRGLANQRALAGIDSSNRFPTSL